jgi:hypothetical protein
MINQRLVRFLTLAALIAVAVGVWIYPHSTTAHDHEFRPNLELCVENLDGTPASQRALGKITAAFNQVKLHPSFHDAQLDRGTGPAIVAGCPSRATILSSTWTGPKYGASDTITQEPSEFHTFVFIVPQATVDAKFGSMYPRLTTQETVCMDHACGEISTAVYITPEELENFDVLKRSLSWGVGLVPEGETMYPGHVDDTTHTHKD